MIILHGLFGSWENWGTQARQYAEQHRVIVVDARNHGRSPHDAEMNYPAMADDVIRLMDQQGIDSAHILGHSMGGKTAMHLAFNHAHRVNKLIVVDISPRQYDRHHNQVFDGLYQIDPQSVSSRKVADERLQQYVPEIAVRSFLLKNLVRTEDNAWRWRINLNALFSQYDHIIDAVDGTPFMGDALFIKGELSDYITERDRDDIARLVPNAQLKMIQKTGHWPHAEKGNAFARIVLNFLNR